ncbi:MAG: ribosomal protein S12 methylthiotransferase accessory factor [Clostridium sp.]|jgi:ribosomal protein S12 methylthiotransferase accessory factor
MNSINVLKYKDELPENTISKIKNILNNLGLIPIESDWKNSAKDFFSLSVSIKGTNISTNGKGTTAIFATASAYAELMERLQNQSFFRLSQDLSSEAFSYESFYYAPDEKYMSIDDVLNSEDDWVKIQMSKVRRDIDKNELLKKWKKLSFEDVLSDFVALPYLNLFSNRLSYIPVKMISKMYMSNGMCAGNSKEEALVQGLSEVFERVANRIILLNKMVPPTVPREYIKNFPRIDRMIMELENSGNYQVIVKDCSLGKMYPVVGVILINKMDQTYFVKFGSHPIVEIALERTLTELLQGQDIRFMRGVKEFSYKNTIDSEKNNLIGILVNGSGYYPSEFFSSNFSYEFKPFENLQGWSNKELLSYLLNILKSEGYNIFARDVSYLGFPSFHIIVPGFSEVENIDDIESLDEYAGYVSLKKMMRNVNSVSDEELTENMNYIKNYKIGGLTPVAQFISLHTKGDFPWFYSSIDLFKVAAYYKFGDFVNAYKIFDDFLKNIDQATADRELFIYYKCVRDYIGTQIDNLSVKESISLLEVFYPISMIKKVYYQFENHELIFKHFGYMNCWNCEECDVKDKCSYKEIEKVYKILKHQYAVNPVNQLNLKNN